MQIFKSGVKRYYNFRKTCYIYGMQPEKTQKHIENESDLIHFQN